MRRAPTAAAASSESIAPVLSPVGSSVAQPATPIAAIRLLRADAGERLALGFLALWIVLQSVVSWPALLGPAFDGPWRHDPAIFAYEGALVRQGGMPYLAFWDHKGPLIYLINAAGLSLADGRIWGVWVVGLLAIIAASAAAYRAMRDAFGVTPALAGLVFFIFALGGIENGSNMTEQYALPLSWASALVLVRWSRTRRATMTTGLALGVLGALAFLLRANLAGAATSAGLTLAVVLIRQRRPAEMGRAAVGAIIGAIAVVAPVTLWLAHGGALHAFWDQAIAYNLLYSEANWTQRIIAALAGLWLSTESAPLLLPVAGLVLCARRLKRAVEGDPSQVATLFMVIWTIIELFFASVSGRAYDHYFMMLLPPMAMLTGALVAELIGSAPAFVRRRLRWPPMVAALLALVMFRPLAEPFVHRARTGGLVPPRASSQTTAAANYIRANSKPSDHLLVWGLAGGAYFLAERPPATRYLFASPLLTRGYGDSIATEFLAEVSRTRPVFIVDATISDPSAPSLARWDPSWRYPILKWYAPHRAVSPSLHPFYEFVAKNYTAVAVVGPERWTVYRANLPEGAQ